jgi:hypothetical protein
MPRYEDLQTKVSSEDIFDRSKKKHLRNIDEEDTNWYIETITIGIKNTVFTTHTTTQTSTVTNTYTNTLSQTQCSTQTSTLTSIYTTSCTYTSTSVTLSTTATRIIYWKSTEYGYYDIAWDLVYSTVTQISCYNTLVWYYTYINGEYTNVYCTSTTKAVSSITVKSTDTIYFSTYPKYTYALLLESGLIYLTSYYASYIYSSIISITNTKTNINSLTYYTTNIQYSTITRIVAPSPSSLPKYNTMKRCNCRGDKLLFFF